MTSPIFGDGVLEVLQDGFGFLRSPEANYLPGPTTSMFAQPDPALCAAHRRHGRGRDPRAEGRRAVFRAAQGQAINFDEPDKVRHRINFDNLTPLYPEEKLKLEATIRPARIHAADDRPDRPARQGPARPDRGPAAHR